MVSGVKTAANKVQTTGSDRVRMVRYSPEKRQKLQQSQQYKSPVKISGLVKNKSRGSTLKVKNTPYQKKQKSPQWMFNSNIMMPLTTGRLHTVKQALDLNIYETVDLKVKMMIKSENKQPILQGDKTKYKMDSVVADDTGTVKLVLWEDTIDKLHIGKCYQIQNCKIRVFDNSKFLNTNEFTKKTEIDEIPNINLATPELQDNIVTGQCLGVDLKCTTSSICCNKTIDETNDEADTVTYPSCSMTLIKDVLQTKVFAKLLMKIDEKLVNYTALNDAVQSFMSNIKCKTSFMVWPAMCKKIPKSRNGSENFPMIPKVRNGSQNSGWFGFAK